MYTAITYNSKDVPGVAKYFKTLRELKNWLHVYNGWENVRIKQFPPIPLVERDSVEVTCIVCGKPCEIMIFKDDKACSVPCYEKVRADILANLTPLQPR